MQWTCQPFEKLSTIELYEIIKLRIDVFVVEQQCPYRELDELDYEAMHFCGKDETGLVAYARLLPSGAAYKDPSIGRVIVRKDRRGVGLAHSLMEQCVERVDELWKPANIRLQAQQHLELFYAGHGFKVISAPYDDDGIPHIDMVLERVSS